MPFLLPYEINTTDQSIIKLKVMKQLLILLNTHASFHANYKNLQLKKNIIIYKFVKKKKKMYIFCKRIIMF